MTPLPGFRVSAAGQSADDTVVEGSVEYTPDLASLKMLHRASLEGFEGMTHF